jgi:hypothetical protein
LRERLDDEIVKQLGLRDLDQAAILGAQIQLMIQRPRLTARAGLDLTAQTGDDIAA